MVDQSQMMGTKEYYLMEVVRAFIRDNEIDADSELEIDWADIYIFIHEICEIAGYCESSAND